ncbi:Glucose-1-phosphate adenylyltransferase [Bienertia sinuspersici]
MCKRSLLCMLGKCGATEIRGCSKARSKEEGSSWIAPPTYQIKVNFDAAVGRQDDHIGVGVRWDPEMAEAAATKVAVQLPREQGWMRVMFEGDAQMVIKAILGESYCSSSAQLLTDDAMTSISYEVLLNEHPTWISDLVYCDYVN